MVLKHARYTHPLQDLATLKEKLRSFVVYRQHQEKSFYEVSAFGHFANRNLCFENASELSSKRKVQKHIKF
jgi:hypothetical protein